MERTRSLILIGLLLVNAHCAGVVTDDEVGAEESALESWAQGLVARGYISPAGASRMQSQNITGPQAQFLVSNFGPLRIHMDGQSHPAINEASFAYDVLFADPFQDDPPPDLGRPLHQSVTLQALKSAIDPAYDTTLGALSVTLRGIPLHGDPRSGQQYDLRTRLMYFSPLCDHEPELSTELLRDRIDLLSSRQTNRLRNDQEKATDAVIRQMAVIDRFVPTQPGSFALATAAADARRKLHAQSDSMVIMTSIEGGTSLVHSQSDADAWRARGVTHMTLIHLADAEHGVAGLVPPGTGFIPRWFNPRGVERVRAGLDPGLTTMGRRGLARLSRAGIVTDMAHMSRQSFTDALQVLKVTGVPAIVSHAYIANADGSDPHHWGDRALTKDQIVALYAAGGHLGLVLTGEAHDPEGETMDGFVEAYDRTLAILHDPVNIQAIFKLTKPTPYDALTLQQKIRLSVAGGAGDFNAMQPAKPKYGTRRGQLPLSQIPSPQLPVDTQGLSHPGVVPSILQMMVRDTKKDPSYLEPLLLGAERSLQISQQVDAYAAASRVTSAFQPYRSEAFSGSSGRVPTWLAVLSDGVGTASDVQAVATLQQAISGLQAPSAVKTALARDFQILADAAAASLFQSEQYALALEVAAKLDAQ